ncbi:hypothetical protein B0H19DRAFT_963828 [Mycena capillaripes]|nr:hypothetical protein B0H19DRAFT_963828 [Mycena capillaripes]
MLISLVVTSAIILCSMLSSITPLVDIISARSEPAALGTQHVALLLAGWAPVLIFGAFLPCGDRPAISPQILICLIVCQARCPLSDATSHFGGDEFIHQDIYLRASYIRRSI